MNTTRWLFLDPSCHASLRARLEALGHKCVHAGEEGLGSVDARRSIDAALEDECILVSTNSTDLAELSEAYRAAGRPLPPIVLLPAEPPTQQASRLAARLSNPIPLEAGVSFLDAPSRDVAQGSPS